jgi:hypothetical protein
MTKSEKIELRRTIAQGVKVAIAEAIEKHRKLGQPITVWRDGKVVTLRPEELSPPPKYGT